MRKEHRLAFTFFEGSRGPDLGVIAAVLFFFCAPQVQDKRQKDA